jgi:hypothetical protein
MTAIRPLDMDRLGRDLPEKAGPEQFAPARHVTEKLSTVDQAAAAGFEGEIREFVRRDVSFLRRPRSDADTASDPVAENLNALIRRVSRASMEEIDRVILELHSVRDLLRKEGERISREIGGYAGMSHAALSAMSVIGDNLAQWKNATNRPGQHPAV